MCMPLRVHQRIPKHPHDSQASPSHQPGPGTRRCEQLRPWPEFLFFMRKFPFSVSRLWWAPKVSKSSKTLQNSSKQASEEAVGCELRCEYLNFPRSICAWTTTHPHLLKNTSPKHPKNILHIRLFAHTRFHTQKPAKML